MRFNISKSCNEGIYNRRNDETWNQRVIFDIPNRLKTIHFFFAITLSDSDSSNRKSGVNVRSHFYFHFQPGLQFDKHSRSFQKHMHQ